VGGTHGVEPIGLLLAIAVRRTSDSSAGERVDTMHRPARRDQPHQAR